MNDDMLEFGIVLNQVAKYALSSMGQEKIQQLLFITDSDSLKNELDFVTELRDLLQYDDPFPFESFEDIRPGLRKTGIQGAFLLPHEFNAVKHSLWCARQLETYFAEHSEKYPLLVKNSHQIVLLPNIENDISNVVNTANEIKDKASPQLQKIRQEKTALSQKIRKRLNAILQTFVRKGIAQEDNLVLRHGRLAIPIKEASRGQMKGVVLDQSASGATVFVEPLEILEMNNDVRRLEIAEQQEIERILKVLTDKLRPNLSSIKLNFEYLVNLDCLYAKANYSLKIKGNSVRINNEDVLHIIQARHPLLLMRENSEGVVPLSIIMKSGLKTLVVTGPNAGGKTVLLKTIGLIALMHQHGLHVPVKEGTTLPVFSNVFADIGDQQSIEKDLSTFSSHIQNLKSILNRADSQSLILLDEIGSATDPGEGAALAMAVLNHFTSEACKTIATTHIGVLKVYAHEEEGIENGSMVFDRQTLRPTYVFQMGVPGSSYAFEIAERLGFSKNIIEKAKSIVGDEKGRLDQLILHLEERLQSAHGLLKKAEIQESKLMGLMKLYQEQLDHLKQHENESKEKAIEEAKELIRNANAMVENVVREIRESQAEKASIQKAKQRIRKQKKELEKFEKISDLKKLKEESYQIKKGDWVRWRDHAGIGKVVTVPNKKGRVFVQYDDLRIEVPESQLIPEASHQVKVKTAKIRYHVDTQLSSEISVRGMNVEEAIHEVEMYLDKAVLSGLSEVRIIHGKGTGTLREKINVYLEKHPSVKKKRLGNYQEGDTGVTIVELK